MPVLKSVVTCDLESRIETLSSTILLHLVVGLLLITGLVFSAGFARIFG